MSKKNIPRKKILLGKMSPVDILPNKRAKRVETVQMGKRLTRTFGFNIGEGILRLEENFPNLLKL